ncbi:MAG: hypothetical protein HND39_02705 [Ignavibacteriota bacterium]|jgi:hypothetical protein|nr:hypothetical protein [Ignavibacteriales bacterium]MBL1122133.1 hypothetical protein [Ignavibacteriota bacterium]MBV6418951.1 hypothetical protein [Ignavibacteriaceae bacterium]MCE7856196.1 hypothetical protein [Ignavibacteria bacterium CHB3]MEB2296662.1 hypothetical protein [Ignavibacteria bacterium]
MGFSVIFDILTATIIGGIILMNLLNLNENVYQTEVTSMMDVNLQVEVINTANVIENDFNKIGYCANPANINDLPKVTLGDSSSIKIVFDADKNGFYDTVYYYVSDTTLLNNTPNPRDKVLYRRLNGNTPYMVSNRITDFRLQYLDALYNVLPTPVASPGLATYIKIAIKVEDPFAIENEYNEAYWRRLTVTAKNLKRN